jgi:hypothetical protein
VTHDDPAPHSSRDAVSAQQTHRHRALVPFRARSDQL